MTTVQTTVDRPQTAGEHLIYSVTTTGHRQSYLDTLSAIFALQPVSGPMNFTLFRRLVAAERLLFAMLDEDMVSFGAIAGARSLLGRPTAALFLRAQKCFETGRWFYPLKRHAFRVLRSLPRLTVASITPFDVAPRHAEVAHCGVFDPQYWDLHDGETLRRPGNTRLSEEVVARAAGRSVLCAIGTLSSNKGLGFLAETLERYPRINEYVLIVGAGSVPSEATRIVAQLKGVEALIVDRFISDAELESLYGIADMVWACYSPDYDQASGVFGRAVQFGAEPITRLGSVIAAFAKLNGINHIPVAYGQHEALAGLLMRHFTHSEPSKRLLQNDRAQLIAGWRRQFIDRIGAGISGSGFIRGKM
ncbi:hypothetical protein [Mesorhizobium sp.]|uniref:hypothetical protein n=1 Tax=Mesorhizobium sp. TaxID=1871066 RepID=UPI0011F478EF|nr:hypothetical protein [Mesorhizobium sp.]TIL54861.1 MAG: hypothetical protein E5Y83_01205 [Mesorhizobium sp.]